MKSCLKTILVGLGLVLIVVALVAFLAATRLNDTIRAGIERTLSHVYQTDVTVDDVAISLTEQTLDIQGMTVASPEPFPEGPAMRFGHVLVRVDLASLATDTPTVNEIVLTGTQIDLRYELGKGTNLTRLADNASRFADTRDPDAPWAARRSFLIKELRTEDAVIHVSANVLPVSSIDIEVAPFTLSDLSPDKAVGTGEVSAIFIRSLLTRGVTMKGALAPIGRRLQEEFDRLTGHGDDEESAPEEPDASAGQDEAQPPSP